MTEETRVPTRMGDGTFTHLTRSEIRADLIAGSEVATKRAKVPLLTDDEIDHLLEIYASPLRFIGVDVGEEIVLSCDGTGMKTHATRIHDLQSYEQWMGADLLELAWATTRSRSCARPWWTRPSTMHDAQLATIAPLQYGVMPNLGLHSEPDGPCDNWNELLPLGRIPEARAAAEEAVEMAVVDMVKLADSQWEAGADAIDWDTHRRRRRPRVPRRPARHGHHPREVPRHGRASPAWPGQFVRGYARRARVGKGVRLAGLLAQGPAPARAAGACAPCSAPSSTSTPASRWPGTWPRAIALIKPCMEVAEIPVHPQRRHGRRRRADVRRPALPTRTCRAAKSLRRASPRRRVVGGLGLMPTECTTPTRKPRASAGFGQAETWLPVCR